jgi:hypothetical protein
MTAAAAPLHKHDSAQATPAVEARRQQDEHKLRDQRGITGQPGEKPLPGEPDPQADMHRHAPDHAPESQAPAQGQQDEGEDIDALVEEHGGGHAVRQSAHENPCVRDRQGQDGPIEADQPDGGTPIEIPEGQARQDQLDRPNARRAFSLCVLCHARRSPKRGGQYALEAGSEEGFGGGGGVGWGGGG